MHDHRIVGGSLPCFLLFACVYVIEWTIGIWVMWFGLIDGNVVMLMFFHRRVVIAMVVSLGSYDWVMCVGVSSHEYLVEPWVGLVMNLVWWVVCLNCTWICGMWIGYEFLMIHEWKWWNGLLEYEKCSWMMWMKYSLIWLVFAYIFLGLDGWMIWES